MVLAESAVNSALDELNESDPHYTQLVVPVLYECGFVKTF